MGEGNSKGGLVNPLFVFLLSQQELMHMRAVVWWWVVGWCVVGA